MITEPTAWMPQQELGKLFGVTGQTIGNRVKSGYVADGVRFESRPRLETDEVHPAVRMLYRAVPEDTERKIGPAERRRLDAAEADAASDIEWQRKRRAELETELDRMRAELVEAQGKIDDAEERYRQALGERIVEAPEHITGLVDAVWTALAEHSLEECRDVLLLALREYVEAT